MKLSEMKPPRGARKKRKVLGRGESSGLGKTSGRGGKGQTARSGGKIRAGFEGGQMPLYRRIPKLGFISRQQTLGLNRYFVVNLSVLEQFDNGATVDAESLRQLGYKARSKERAGVKILGNGTLSKKLTVRVDKISDSAKKKIEDLGGKVEIVQKGVQEAPAA